jgi:hypothetical protein
MKNIIILVDSEIKRAFERSNSETLQKLTTIINL